MFDRGEVALQFTAVGEIAGGGSKSAHLVTRGDKSIVFRNAPKILGGKVWGWPMFNMTHDSDKTEPWMKLVGQEAALRWKPSQPLDGAIYLDVTWYEKRPSGHFFHRKDGDVLRPDAPLYPHVTTTHDFDKLRRAISDALTQAKVIADDKRVVMGNGWKCYADAAPRLECAAIRMGQMLHQVCGEEPGLIPPPPVEGQISLTK